MSSTASHPSNTSSIKTRAQASLDQRLIWFTPTQLETDRMFLLSDVLPLTALRALGLGLRTEQ